MSTHDWQDIEHELKAVGHAREPRPAVDFWADFKKRAALEPQDVRAPAPQPRPIFRWAAAAAAAMLLLVLLGWAIVRPQSGAATREPVPIAQVIDGNEIKSLEVFVSSDGYIIMNDRPEDGMILWITGHDETPEDTAI